MCDNMRNIENDVRNEAFNKALKAVADAIRVLNTDTLIAIADKPEYLTCILTNNYSEQSNNNDSATINENPTYCSDVVEALENARCYAIYDEMEKFGFDLVCRIAAGAWDRYRSITNL